jgi:hypothetical protein
MAPLKLRNQPLKVHFHPAPHIAENLSKTRTMQLDDPRCMDGCLKEGLSDIIKLLSHDQRAELFAASEAVTVQRKEQARSRFFWHCHIPSPNTALPSHRPANAPAPARRPSIPLAARNGCEGVSRQVVKAGGQTDHIYFVREGELVEILDAGGTDGPIEVGVVKVPRIHPS